MPVPGYQPRQLLLISDLNQFCVTAAAWKGADTPRASVTSLAPDPDLTLALNSQDGIYQVKAIIRYQGAAGNNFAWNWSIPSGASFEYSHWNYFSSAAVSPTSASPGGTQTAWCDGGAGRRIVTARGVVIMGGTPGVITLNWAQGAVSATATVVGQFSQLQARQVG